MAIVGPLGLLRTDNADSALGLVDGNWLWLPLVLAVVLVVWQTTTVATGCTRFLPALAASVGLQVGGLVANLVDRFVFGTVTDFIDLRVGSADQGLVLNPADLGLGAGALLLTALTWAAMSRSLVAPASRETAG